MRAVLIDRFGSNSLPKMCEAPEPNIQNHQILVAVHAAALNPVDTKIRQGKMWPLLNFELPLILGNDIAGTVAGVGSAVTRFKIGDRVFATLDKKKLGAFADFAAVDETHAAKIPDAIGFAEAAAIPLIGLTVYQALVETAGLSAGQKVFIKAGSGGIGTFAIPFAKAKGAYVATTTSTANIEWVKGLGADEVIDYTKERFENRLADFDIVIDSVDGDDVCRGYEILKPGGHLIALAGPPDAKFARAFGAPWWVQLACGVLSARETITAALKRVNFDFIFVKPSGMQLEEIAAMISSGQIKPVIDRIFPFSEVSAAFDYAETGRAKGKVILSLKE